MADIIHFVRRTLHQKLEFDRHARTFRYFYSLLPARFLHHTPVTAAAPVVVSLKASPKHVLECVYTCASTLRDFPLAAAIPKTVVNTVATYLHLTRRIRCDMA